MKSKWVLVALFTAVIIASGFTCGMYILRSFINAREWLLQKQTIGALTYILIFCSATPLLFPYAPFCIAAGYIWDIPLGFAIQSIAIVASSTIIYTTSACCFKKKVEKWLSRYHSTWKSLVDDFGVNTCECNRINLILCFVPMPYAVHAYIFGLTKYPVWWFVPVFKVGMLPHTFLNLILGRAMWLAAQTRDNTRIQNLQMTFFLASSFVTIATICYGIAYTRHYITKKYSQNNLHAAAQFTVDSPTSQSPSQSPSQSQSRTFATNNIPLEPTTTTQPPINSLTRTSFSSDTTAPC